MSPTCRVHSKTPEEQIKQMVTMCSSKVSGMDAKKKKKKKQLDNAPAVASVLKTRVIKKELKKQQKKTNSPISIQVDLCIAPQR